MPSVVPRTEKKRPFEDEIMQCGVLLVYLERHESQAEPSADVKEVGATNEVEGNDCNLHSLNLCVCCPLFYRNI